MGKQKQFLLVSPPVLLFLTAQPLYTLLNKNAIVIMLSSVNSVVKDLGSNPIHTYLEIPLSLVRLASEQISVVESFSA